MVEAPLLLLPYLFGGTGEVSCLVGAQNTLMTEEPARNKISTLLAVSHPLILHPIISVITTLAVSVTPFFVRCYYTVSSVEELRTFSWLACSQKRTVNSCSRTFGALAEVTNLQLPYEPGQSEPVRSPSSSNQLGRHQSAGCIRRVCCLSGHVSVCRWLSLLRIGRPASGAFSHIILLKASGGDLRICRCSHVYHFLAAWMASVGCTAAGASSSTSGVFLGCGTGSMPELLLQVHVHGRLWEKHACAADLSGVRGANDESWHNMAQVSFRGHQLPALLTCRLGNAVLARMEFAKWNEIHVFFRPRNSFDSRAQTVLVDADAVSSYLSDTSCNRLPR